MTTHDERLDHTPLTFGKYKGKTPSEIAVDDPSYIVWMHNNIKRPLCSYVLAKDCAETLLATRQEDGDFEDDAFGGDERFHGDL